MNGSGIATSILGRRTRLTLDLDLGWEEQDKSVFTGLGGDKEY